MDTVSLIFVLLFLYQLKHFLADYILQGSYMLGKFKPGWDFVGPLTAHVLVHGVMTAAIAFMLLHGPLLGYAFLIGAFDATVHFIMDRIKASPKMMGRWKPLSGPEYVECRKYLALPQKAKDLRDKVNLAQWSILAPCSSNPIPPEKVEVGARRQLRNNTLFWWALGFDQMVHHCTHYVCIFFMLRLAGAL